MSATIVVIDVYTYNLSEASSSKLVIISFKHVQKEKRKKSSI